MSRSVSRDINTLYKSEVQFNWRSIFFLWWIWQSERVGIKKSNSHYNRKTNTTWIELFICENKVQRKPMTEDKLEKMLKWEMCAMRKNGN